VTLFDLQQLDFVMLLAKSVTVSFFEESSVTVIDGANEQIPQMNHIFIQNYYLIKNKIHACISLAVPCHLL
jgi:hypothetical protein